MQLTKPLLIKMIWSTDVNGNIGTTYNELLFHSKVDMNHFKSITTGSNNAVVMGRRTYESIGKPLPNRLNIVLTKNQEFKFDLKLGEALKDCVICHSLWDVFNACTKHNIECLWVIGGAEIYEQFFELADELFVTKFSAYSTQEPEALVTFLPDLTEFSLVNSESYTDIDSKTKLNLYFDIEYWRRVR